MSTRRKRRPSKGPTDLPGVNTPQVGSPDLEDRENNPELVTQPEVPSAKPVPLKAVEARPAVPKRKYCITVEQFVVNKGPIGEAFAYCERLENPHTRRLTEQEWAVEMDTFVKAPRGSGGQ